MTDDAVTSMEWTMNGGHPVSWDCAWAELAWCHPRRHRPLSATPSSPVVEITVNRPNAQLQCTNEQQPIALENGLTSRNNPKKAKKQALRAHECKTKAAALPSHANGIEIGQLVFVSVDLDSAEGELAIGLARVVQICDGDECKLMWFVRKEWCRQPRQHEWSKSPTFRVAADPNNAARSYMSRENVSKVLPIQVSLTKTSKTNFPRLDASCVRLLRELCSQRGLLVSSPHNMPPQQNDDSSEGDVGRPTSDPCVDDRISSRLLSRKRACRRSVVRDDSSENSDS